MRYTNDEPSLMGFHKWLKANDLQRHLDMQEEGTKKQEKKYELYHQYVQDLEKKRHVKK